MSEDIKIKLKDLFDKLNISNNHENCSYCNKPLDKELWCEECDPYKKFEGRTIMNIVLIVVNY